MSDRRKTLLVDFDATLHTYVGWQGPEERFLAPPLEGARHAMHILSREFRLILFTSRPEELCRRYLRAHGFPEMGYYQKPSAFLIIDDRAITFPGQWTDDFLAAIRAFRPHWEADQSQSPTGSSA